MESALARDADAVALLAELRHTNAALAGSESEVKLPESREFFWSKIEREIQRQEQEPRAETQPSWFWLLGWRRVLVPVGAVAALTVLLASLQMNFRGVSPPAGIVAAFTDEHAFTYRDQSQGTTLVWLSYGADDKSMEGDSEEIIQD